MYEMPIKPSIIRFNKREVKEIVHNRRRIRRVVINRVQIWSNISYSDYYLELEKSKVELDKYNNWEDTNQVNTNTQFSVK